jgi:hypothetical protein
MHPRTPSIITSYYFYLSMSMLSRISIRLSYTLGHMNYVPSNMTTCLGQNSLLLLIINPSILPCNWNVICSYVDFVTSHKDMHLNMSSTTIPKN